jgi:hypothetical protein
MRRLSVLLLLLAVPPALFAAEPRPKRDEMVNNPPFANWSQFPVGTSVTQRETVTLSDGSKVQQEITSKLVEKSAAKVVVETSMTDKSGETAEESRSVTTYPAKVKMSQVDTPDSATASITEGKDTLEVKGKKVDAEWVEVVTKSGDQIETQKLWTAREIPGGIIKRTVTRKTGDKIVSQSQLDLVEFK